VLSDAQQSHGDLIATSRYVLALRWSALDADNQTVLAGLRANRAHSAAQMVEAFSAYHSPMQNLVVADSAGASAFKAVGKVPLRRPDNDIRGLAPAPGWEARYDWDGWLADADKPQTGSAAIAARGWLATANQKVTPEGYRFFIGQDWTVPYRFDRIEALLAAQPKHDMASMQKIQADQHSAATLRLLPFLTAAAASSTHALAGAARQALSGFDGEMAADSAAPLLFAAWVDELTRGLLGGKLGEARLKALYGKRHFRSTVEEIMLQSDAEWCGAAGCAAQSEAAFGRALDRLSALYGADPGGWRWGAAHTALSAHRPFGNVPSLARFFDLRVPTGGDTFSVNVGQYWTSDQQQPFLNRQAASLRAVYDLADLEKSVFIYQTGQSGLVFSARYRDMSQRWAEVGYRPLRMDGAAQHSLTLAP
jgi:penicillin amidase